MTRTTRISLAVLAGCVLVAIACPKARADEPKPLQALAKTDHFLVLAFRDDVDAGRVPDDVVRDTAAWCEAAWKTFVVDAGFRAPPPRKAGRMVVILGDIADALAVRGAAGVHVNADRYDRYRNTLWLNLSTFRRVGAVDPVKGAAMARHTVPHEVFHAIQSAYDPEEEMWFREATAAWAGLLAAPDVKKPLLRERQVIRTPRTSLHAYERTSGGAYDTSEGRPYGASLFLRFAAGKSKVSEAKFLRNLWEITPGKRGPSAFWATSLVLGDTAALGERFRDAYASYVRGCVLLDKAPAEDRLPDVEQFERFRPFIDDRTTLLEEYLSRRAKEGSSAKPLSGKASLGGLATRYVKMKIPRDAPKGASLELTLRGPAKEALLQVLWRRAGAWERATASPASDGAKATASTPALDAIEGPLVLCVSRVADSTERADLEIGLSLANDETWVPDLPRTERGIRERKPAAGEKPPTDAGIKFALMMLGGFRISLKADASFAFSAGSPQAFVRGTWTREAGRLRLHATEVGPDADFQAGNDIVLEPDGDLLRLGWDEAVVWFRRKE